MEKKDKFLVGVIAIMSIVFFIYYLNGYLWKHSNSEVKSAEWRSIPCPSRISESLADSLKQVPNKEAKSQ